VYEKDHKKAIAAPGDNHAGQPRAKAPDRSLTEKPSREERFPIEDKNIMGYTFFMSDVLRTNQTPDSASKVKFRKGGDKAIRYFTNAVKKKISSSLQHLIVFGSRARGDFKEYSDYDFIIIVTEKDKSITEEIFEIEYDFLHKFDIPASALVYTPREWEIRLNSPLGKRVQKEGITLV
jgi:predicted nucleotidyltransferase